MEHLPTPEASDEAPSSVGTAANRHPAQLVNGLRPASYAATVITTQRPSNWRDLQRQVARILEECRFQVEVEKVVTTVRGSAEIDVFAQEEVNGRRYTVLCECKNWARNVSQDVIRSFRTVVADTGANVGYVISSVGFQPGAVRAAESTNLQLLAWDDFQATFEPAWVDRFLRQHVVDRIDPLFSY